MNAASAAAGATLGIRPDVMVVEDDADVRETVRELLEEQGYRVVPASNGRDALAQLRAWGAPRVLLLDLMMPVMDGWELHAAMARDPELSGIPVVVMSADSALESKVAGLSVAAILPKPVTLQRLLDTVRQFAGGDV
jgi:CheY-like chemotaxis protein